MHRGQSSFLEQFLTHNNSHVAVQSFFASYRHFHILDQTDQFAKAIAHASWSILAIFKMLSFFESQCFLERFSAHNNSNVLVQCFFAPFWPFQILSQTDQFAKAIAFASWPILAIFKKLSFFKYYVFFGAAFCTKQI